MSSKTKLDTRFTDILWGQEHFQRVSAEASYQHHLTVGAQASYQHHLLLVSTVVEGIGWCHVSCVNRLCPVLEMSGTFSPGGNYHWCP